MPWRRARSKSLVAERDRCALPPSDILEKNVEILREMRSALSAVGARFVIGLYVDPVWAREPEDRRHLEAWRTRLAGEGFDVFLFESHVRRLTPAQARVRLNDHHPGPRAVSLMAEDAMGHLF